MPDQTSEAIRNAETFPAFVRAIAGAYGDTPAIELAEGEGAPEALRSLTFAELEAKSAELARGLLACGVGKGTRVGFVCGNGPLFVLLYAAIARIGAVAIPFSTLLKAGELVRVLRQSDVALLFVQQHMLGYDYVERVLEALPALRAATSADLRLPEAPYLRSIVSLGPSVPASFRDLAFLSEAAGTVSEEMLREVEAEVHSTDQIVEIYTSGSMALPKGVRHDHGPVLFRTDYLRRMTDYARGEQRPMYQPLFWVGGLAFSLMPALAAGATTVCTEKTPTNSLMAMGSVLNAENLEAFAAARPYWALGMSETLGPYTYGDILRVPGRPLCAPIDNVADGYEVRVADQDDRPVGDGETGEIQVRGYPLTPRLHKLKRDDYFTPDGYYRTGDMGLVEGARIHFVGRNGDMIKTAGSNVSPAEVEMEMQQIAGIQSAYVVGLPDQDRGQIVVAAVVPREGEAVDFGAVAQELKKKLSSYKVPRAYFAIAREDVPMLFSNKVSRRQIETMLAERMKAMA